MQQFPDGRKPAIEYPLKWQYKLIGRDESRMRDEVARIVGARPFALAPSHTSRTGRYVSLSLEVEVQSEAERLGLFAALGSSGEIMYVI